MIVVFCEFGGDKLLGKAREIADSQGFRVVALFRSQNASESQRLILLGADEVVDVKEPENIFDWANAISSFISSRPEIRYLFAASGLTSDAVLARAYALGREKIGRFATGIETVNEAEASKIVAGSKFVYKIAAEGNLSVFSFKLGGFPEPLEDTSRYGKVTETSLDETARGKKSPETKGLEQTKYLDSSSVITFLVGKSLEESDEIQKAASKYHAKIVKYSSQISDIYGPCLALDLKIRHERELPRFHREVIALATSEEDVIRNAASSTYVTNDIEAVTRSL